MERGGAQGGGDGRRGRGPQAPEPRPAAPPPLAGPRAAGWRPRGAGAGGVPAAEPERRRGAAGSATRASAGAARCPVGPLLPSRGRPARAVERSLYPDRTADGPQRRPQTPPTTESDGCGGGASPGARPGAGRGSPATAPGSAPPTGRTHGPGTDTDAPTRRFWAAPPRAPRAPRPPGFPKPETRLPRFRSGPGARRAGALEAAPFRSARAARPRSPPRRTHSRVPAPGPAGPAWSISSSVPFRSRAALSCRILCPRCRAAPRPGPARTPGASHPPRAAGPQPGPPWAPRV